MTSYHSVSIMNSITKMTPVVLALTALVSSTAGAENGYERGLVERPEYTDLDVAVKRIRGIAVTGVNSVRGRPLFNWGEPFGTFHFPAVFAYNKYGSEPLVIDENTPDSAILATGVSPKYLLTRGETPDVVKPEWVNVPLRKIPVNIDFSYIEKVPLRGLLEADLLELAQSEPADPITLGQWLNASGFVTIKCSDDRANIKLQMRNLLPNRIYSAWATVDLPEDIAGESGRYSSTLPIGGTPNIFMTDEGGDAIFEREIKFCPFLTQSEDIRMPNIPMLNIEVLYHADHETYGAIPAPGIMLGLITFSHVVFPVSVELLDDSSKSIHARD